LNRIGLNSIQTPVQFVTYPIAPEKSGIVMMLIVSELNAWAPAATLPGRHRPRLRSAAILARLRP
jgi:hypothetical protein